MVLEIKIIAKVRVLESRFQTSDSAQLVRLTGKDRNYNFTREFLNGTNQGTKFHPVEPGDLFEVSETHWSGESTNHTYYRVQADMPQLVEINYAEVTRSFM